MHSSIKNILRKAGVYYPLQSFYRNIIFFQKSRRYRRQYKGFAGSGYTCNVCGAMYTRFVPDHPTAENRTAIESNGVIAGYGENIFCPACMSTARERLLIAFLSAMIDLKGKKILHLSPEKNVFHFLIQQATVTTADLLPGFYKTIDGMVQKQDATNLGFADNSFDMVIANHILEHIPDDRKAMREIFRVMKPAARAILQVPYSEKFALSIEEPFITDSNRQSALFGQKDHVRIYSLKDYVQRLKDAGFLVIVFDENELTQFLKFATQPAEKLILVTKP